MSDVARPSFARTWIRRAEVGSTNDLARSLLIAGAVELPVVVEADRQTAGRGRESRSWWSDAGSLTVSVGLDPAALGLRVEQAPRVALAAAVALVDVLEPAWLPAGTLGIRWPNDLEAGGRKLAGILPEWVETDCGGRMVVGIGLNVTTDLDAAPEEVHRMATSVAALAGGPAPDRGRIRDALISRLGLILAALGRDDPGLAARWASLDTLRGREVRVDLGSRIVAGRGAGITATGGLQLDLTATDLGGPGTMVLYGGQVLRDPL